MARAEEYPEEQQGRSSKMNAWVAHCLRDYSIMLKESDSTYARRGSEDSSLLDAMRRGDE